jgi:hypothetical protein
LLGKLGAGADGVRFGQRLSGELHRLGTRQGAADLSCPEAICLAFPDS